MGGRVASPFGRWEDTAWRWSRPHQRRRGMASGGYSVARPLLLTSRQRGSVQRPDRKNDDCHARRIPLAREAGGGKNPSRLDRHHLIRSFESNMELASVGAKRQRSRACRCAGFSLFVFLTLLARPAQPFVSFLSAGPSIRVAPGLAYDTPVKVRVQSNDLPNRPQYLRRCRSGSLLPLNEGMGSGAHGREDGDENVGNDARYIEWREVADGNWQADLRPRRQGGSPGRRRGLSAGGLRRIRDPWEGNVVTPARIMFPRTSTEAMDQAVDAVEHAIDRGGFRLRVQLNLPELDIHQQPLARSALPELIRCTCVTLAGCNVRMHVR